MKIKTSANIFKAKPTLPLVQKLIHLFLEALTALIIIIMVIVPILTFLSFCTTPNVLSLFGINSCMGLNRIKVVGR